MADRVGQQLGNYRLLRLLGEGGFSEVYLGEHVHLGTEAAIKILRAQLGSTDIEQFRREARIIARLDHPHIVRVLDFGVEEGTPFLVMSYAPNGTLRKRYPKGSRLPLSVVIPYTLDIADALYYTHQQKLVHRDIKPENLLLGRNNEILLGDFGIALTQSTRLGSNYDLAGTALYMAPEQIQSHPRPASDQYSLAIIVYEWLGGERPFSGSFSELVVKHNFVTPPPLRERVPELPAALEQVVMTALAKDPQQRFSTIKAFATALAQASGLPGYARSLPGISAPPVAEDPSVSQTPTVLQSLPPTLLTPSGLSMPAISSAPSPNVPSTPIAQSPSPNVPSTPVTQPPSPAIPSTPLLTPVQHSAPMLPIDPTVPAFILPAPAGQVNNPPSSPGYPSPAADSTNTTLSNQPLLTPAFHHTDIPAPLPRGVSRRTLLIGGLVSLGALGGLAAFLAIHSKAGTTVPRTPTTSLTVTSPSLTSQGAMFGYDPGRTHFNPQETILSAHNVMHLTSLTGWPLKGLMGTIVASPVVAGTTVYVASWDHNLYAFHALTGKLLWTAPTGAPIDSSPAVAGDIVFIASQDTNIYAFAAATGKPLWSTPFSTGGQIDFSSPVVADGILYIGSHDHKLYALDAQTGRLLWNMATQDEIWSSPAVSNGVVYISSRDAHLYAVQAQTGKLLWSASISDGSDSSPAVSNGLVYVGSYDNRVYAFHALTGKPAWTKPFATNGKINSSPAVANGTVYIGSADHNLYALDALSGKPVWSSPAHTSGKIESSPSVANGVVYVGSDDAHVYAFDASSGTMLWSFATGGSVFSSPTISQGILYIASEDGRLYAFHAAGSDVSDRSYILQ